MKRFSKLVINVLAVSLLLLSSTAYAAEMWSEEYYRVQDAAEVLSEAEVEELDAIACEFVDTYHYDIVMAALDEEDIEESLYDSAYDFYWDNGFGYGENRDGLMMAMNMDTEDVEIICFGEAERTVTEDYLDFVKDSIVEFNGSFGASGAMYVYERYMADYMVDVFDLPELTLIRKDAGAQGASEEGISGDAGSESGRGNGENGSGDIIERAGENEENLPAWYPANLTTFKRYNDPTAPRVVDDADIFTDEEEASMLSLINEYVPELGKDIVIYTDNSAYGLEHSVLAVDFYDFNGYGIGPENEGICLMICMDPEDRGWWAAATGPESRAPYKEWVANVMDDVLYDFIKDGAYGSGALNWIENVHTLYTKGVPLAPYWYPNVGEAPRVADASVPRVIDDANIFSQEELAHLKTKAKDISDKLGIDVVLVTTPDDYKMGVNAYSDDFYALNGYGFGEDHAGIQLALFPNYEMMYITRGGGLKHCTDKNFSRLKNHTEKLVEAGKYYEAADSWLSYVDSMERKGRVPRGIVSWLVTLLGGTFLGEIIGFGALGKAKKKMVTVHLATNANAYVDGTPMVKRVKDIYLRTRTTTRTITRSSGGSSGGRSSGGSSRSTYSSSYTGTSGRSHTGSGRKF